MQNFKVWLLSVVVLLVIGLNQAFATDKRDPFLQPFSPSSIWNMPIGSNAVYKKANIKKAARLGVDTEYFYKLKSNDPMRPVFFPGAWGVGRCTGKKTAFVSLPIPDDLIVPDATKTSTPNNASAFLMPDRKTLVQLEPLSRCEKGGPIYGYKSSPDVSIYGMGIGGSHFGSGLSAIGGSIRKGELTSSKPIPHALKLLVWGKKYLYYSNDIKGYRWPADRSDSYASKLYGGSNPSLVQGTLLAIPPNVTPKSIDIQNKLTLKLFHALQDYGAYIVDDAAWDNHYLAAENGVVKEVKDATGISINNVSSGKYYQEFNRLIETLQIVDNNSKTSVGGGGKPRVPLAPPLRRS